MKRLFIFMLFVAAAVGSASVQDQHKVFLPFIAVGNIYPDKRFGIANYSVADAASLGFYNDGRYISHQSQVPPDPNSSTFFVRPSSITSPKVRWCTVAYNIAGRPDRCANPDGSVIAAQDGWVDEDAFRNFLENHPGKAWIIGNEALCGEPCGDGLNPNEYARWHRAAYTFIKSVDPSAKVSQWGTIGLGDGNVEGGGDPEKEFLLQFWGEYRRMYGEPLPSDFFPIHHYGWPGTWTLELQVEAITAWVEWLDSHRGTEWVGPRDYWLTEYGMPAWRTPIEPEEAYRYMNEVTRWLMTNQIGISCWAWWPSSNVNWPDKSVRLLENGIPTELGRLYYDLSIWRP